MAKQNHETEKRSPPASAAWGTWEELLLAYAVNRFGTNNWDSISSELRKRSSASITITPKSCKQKYQELQRRFNLTNGDDVDIDDGGHNTTTIPAPVPWIEELRKLRVAELQRQLQNLDICISSLQLKVKKLTGERNSEEINNKRPGLTVSGVDASYRENQSMNGSNENLETGAEKSENESDPVRTAKGKRGEGSCDARPDCSEPVKTEPGEIASQEPESKSEGTVVVGTSDVQSTVGKSMSDRVRRGNTEVNERDIPVKSWPLIGILQQAHNLGSAIFERRLDRQEKLKYENLIKERIDFKIIEARLKEGCYSNGNNKFFRDLLLLVNNTCIFHSIESPESIAAIKLREFIVEEMTTKKKQKTGSYVVVKQSSSIVKAVGMADGGGSGGGQMKETDSRGKRTAGRPPKKAVAKPSAAGVLGKRNKEFVESESLGFKRSKEKM